MKLILPPFLFKFSSQIALPVLFPFYSSLSAPIHLSEAMGKKNRAKVSVEEEPFGEEENEQQPMENDAGDSSSVGKSLYEILGVERAVSQQEIKKAYHKLALRLHPDKNPNDEEAKEKFQQLQKVMSILGDEEKRALYDQTGFVDDDGLAGEASQNLQEYFRSLYKKVTVADIEEFKANYRGSDSEKSDLINLYKDCKGAMKKLFCSMLCSDPLLDSHRFKDIIDEAIASGALKETKAYKKWAKKVSETKAPTSPLRQSKEKSKKPDSDLYAIISQRRSQRKDQFESMFSTMISKYGGAENSNAGSEEPTEEEFEAAQRKMEKARKSKKSKHK